MRKTIFKMDAPHYDDGEIEVYTNEEDAGYEWKLTCEGKVMVDTGKDGPYPRAYGIAAVALRDALMVATGMPDPNTGAYDGMPTSYPKGD